MDPHRIVQRKFIISFFPTTSNPPTIHQSIHMPSKPTYAKCILQTVVSHGMVSRAQLTKEAKKQGLDKATPMKNALKKAVQQGVLELSGKSYILGFKSRDTLKPKAAEQYEAALQKAMSARDEAKEKKAAGRERAEAQYKANILQAVSGPASRWNRGV